LSIALRKLRDTYKDDLIVYSSGDPVHTPLGSDLRIRTQEVLRLAKDTLDTRITFDPATARDTFRIISTDILEMTCFRHLFSLVNLRAPGIRTTYLPFDYEPVETLLRQDVDLIVVSETFATDKHPQRAIFSDSFSCLVWEGNQRVGDVLTPETFLTMPQASFAQIPRHVPIEITNDPLGNALSELNSQSNIVLRASAAALPHIIVGKDLLVTTPTSFANYCASFLPLRVLNLPFEVPPLNYVAQWHVHRAQDPSIIWLLAHVIQAAKSMGPS
jgi:LysR family nod box-dependent transcriptional activator